MCDFGREATQRIVFEEGQELKNSSQEVNHESAVLLAYFISSVCESKKLIGVEPAA